jgi:hypothetical protein
VYIHFVGRETMLTLWSLIMRIALPAKGAGSARVSVKA